MVYVARIGRLLYIHFHAHRCVEGQRQREPHFYYNEIGSQLMYPQVKISFCASITQFKVDTKKGERVEHVQACNKPDISIISVNSIYPKREFDFSCQKKKKKT